MVYFLFCCWLHSQHNQQIEEWRVKLSKQTQQLVVSERSSINGFQRLLSERTHTDTIQQDHEESQSAVHRMTLQCEKLRVEVAKTAVVVLFIL